MYLRSKILFISNLKKLTYASKRDVLELATLRPNHQPYLKTLQPILPCPIAFCTQHTAISGVAHLACLCIGDIRNSATSKLSF